MQWLSERPRITYLLLFLVAFGVYATVSGKRLTRQSSDPHFVLQAHAWLQGSLTIPQPWKGDDPAKVETVLSKDGKELRGRYLQTRFWSLSDPWFEARITGKKRVAKNLPMQRYFRTTGGEDVAATTIARGVKTDHYVSFPPTPSLLMLPQVLVQGRRANDVFPTVLVAALILPLCFATLRRLSSEGLSSRSDSDNLWLSALLSFGTVLFFVSVQGKVWFTAHVCGVALALGYAYFSIGAKRPVLAGILLGLATLSRTPMAFMFPFFALEAYRVAGGKENWPKVLRLWVRFAIPVIVIAVVAAIHNYLRFDSFGEFGHSYLAVRQQAMIEEYGLFDYEYLRRNLSVAFTLLPELSSTAPYVRVSGHGMALWITTPLFLTLLWPTERGPVHRALWLTVGLIAIPILCYQNSGWFQFGYRFSLDYTVFLVLLLAVGARKLGQVSKGLIIAGILVNLFGAWTFGRSLQYYDGSTYDTVIPHQPKH